MISYGDYYIRKKKFEEEGRNTYLAGDLNKFTSQTSEFMAFVDNYINQLTTDELDIIQYEESVASFNGGN
jgi:hypothetical protein